MGRFIKTALPLLVAVLSALPSAAQEPFSPATLLPGSTSSVLVSPVTGSAGEELSVLIRGGSGIRGASQPVWIVDGVEINPYVNFLNIYDIEDIKVVKNLYETGKYGNRGADGAVIVTTAIGSGEDKFSIRWNSDLGLTFPLKKVAGAAPGFNHNHYLSLIGTTSRAEYGVSGWFRQTDGVEPHNNGLAGGVRTRFEMRANKVLSFGMNSAFVMGRNNMAACDEPFGSGSLTLLQRNPEFFPDQSIDGWKNDYDNETLDKRFVSDLFLRTNIGKFVKIKLNFGFDFRNSNNFLWYGEGTPIGREENGRATIEGDTDFAYNADLTFTFNRYFKEKHKVSIDADVDVRGKDTKRGYMSGNDFFTHSLRARGLNLYNSDPSVRKFQYTYLSYGARLSAGYEYAGMAGVNAMLRMDHTPRYESLPRLYKNFDGWFDAAKLIPGDGKIVPTLKLSASYGEAGRERNLPYAGYSDFLTGEYPAVPDNLQMFYEGFWRLRTREITAGLELGFLNDRIRIAACYFDRATEDNFNSYCFGQKDGYYWRRAPRQDQFGRSARTLMRGIEGEISGVILKGEGYRWDAFADISYNVSQISSIGDEDLPGAELGSGLIATANALGYPAASFYGHRTDENGDPVDVTGDGIVNRYDREVIGNPHPKFYGNFGTSFAYKGLSLSVLASWAAGFDVLDLNKLLFKGGPDFTVTDRYVGKGDYLRLSKVRAAYDIPLKKQTVVKSVAVSLTGYDLIYWRAFPRWNPAVLGVNYDVCPTSAAMLLGVSLTFGRK